MKKNSLSKVRNTLSELVFGSSIDDLPHGAVAKIPERPVASPAARGKFRIEPAHVEFPDS